MDPDKVVAARQVVGEQVEAVLQVTAPVLKGAVEQPVEACYDIARGARAHHGVGDAARAVPQYEVLEQRAVAVASVPGITPQGAALGVRHERGHGLVLAVDRGKVESWCCCSGHSLSCRRPLTGSGR